MITIIFTLSLLFSYIAIVAMINCILNKKKDKIQVYLAFISILLWGFFYHLTH